MKRKFIMLTACLFATTAFAQIESESKEVDNIDWQEDTTEIVTIAARMFRSTMTTYGVAVLTSTSRLPRTR